VLGEHGIRELRVCMTAAAMTGAWWSRQRRTSATTKNTSHSSPSRPPRHTLFPSVSSVIFFTAVI